MACPHIVDGGTASNMKGSQSRGLNFFNKKKESKIINWGQDFLYITESYQQLTELFVSDRMSYSSERLLV